MTAGRRAAASRDGASTALRSHLAAHWLRYAAIAILTAYVLVFVRGLAWQWRGILFATRTMPPAAASARPVPPPAQSQPGAAPAAPAPAARQPLPPTDEPPPRNTTDRHGVFYDANGVAVTGIDADPSGVYNVPPGRQLRIGGPAGALFDVLPGGKLQPATRIKEWPP